MLGHFYFSTFKDKMLLTNDAGNYMLLSREDFNNFVKGKAISTPEIQKDLQHRMFCSDESVEGYVRYCENEMREGNRYLFESTNLFIFAITNECNNRCMYCQANGTRAMKQMNIDVAEQALKRISECPAKNITIEFQGGEPLMNFPVIKYIVNRATEILSEKEVGFTLVTNLSLITTEMAQFIKDNHISVSTSMDGPAALHDLNRPAANGFSSFAAMQRGKELLDEYGIKAGAIQTTTKASLAYPKEIVKSYIDNGFRQIFLRPLTRLGAAAKCWDQIGYKPEEFLAFYRTALAEIIEYNKREIPIVEYHAALFLSKILQGKAVNYMELRSPCGAAIGQMAITASGNVYTCDEGRMIAESGDEAFLLGNVFDSGYNDWINSSCCKAICSASLLETLPGCCDCVYKPYCGVCPVINYAINGSITRVSRDRCRIYKGILGILFEYLYINDGEVLRIFSEWSEQA